MTKNEAKGIIELYQDIDGFEEPLPSISDYVADAIFKAQERRLEQFDGLCMNVLRQMVLNEARKTLKV